MVARSADRKERNVETARLRLKMHMSSDEPDHDVPRVHFFLEHNWAKEFCKSPICNEAIEWGKYRIAVVPGEKTLAESYHVRCFEELADFSQEDYLDRLRPLIHSTAVTLRGLKESSDWHKRWYLDAGTMRLVLEWKTLMKFLLCAKSSMASGCLPEVFDLSAIVQNKGPVEYLPDELEAYIQTPIDDPTECDGPEDQEPWNLFERYMSLTAKSIGKLKDFKDLRDLEKRHTLSEMLESWSKDQWLVFGHACYLSDKEKALRTKMSGKAVRAIDRLSTKTSEYGMLDEKPVIPTNRRLLCKPNY